MNQCSPPPPVPVILQGEDYTLTIQLISNKTGFPVDLTGATEIVAGFLKSDGSTLEKKLSTAGITILNAPGGTFQVILLSTDTPLMAVGFGDGFQNVSVKYVISSKTTIVNMPNSIQVAPPLVALP